MMFKCNESGLETYCCHHGNQTGQCLKQKKRKVHCRETTRFDWSHGLKQKNTKDMTNKLLSVVLCCLYNYQMFWALVVPCSSCWHFENTKTLWCYCLSSPRQFLKGWEVQNKIMKCETLLTDLRQSYILENNFTRCQICYECQDEFPTDRIFSDERCTEYSSLVRCLSGEILSWICSGQKLTAGKTLSAVKIMGSKWKFQTSH